MVNCSPEFTVRKRRLTISLLEADYESLATYAAGQDRSMCWVVAQAVRQYLSGEQPEQLQPHFIVAQGDPRKSPHREPRPEKQRRGGPKGAT